MFAATLFIIPRNWRQARCFQGLSRFKGYGTSNPMEHNSAVKINELIRITTCVNLQRIVCCSVPKSCLTLCDPMDVARQAPLSSTIFWSLFKLRAIQLVILSNHLILTDHSRTMIHCFGLLWENSLFHPVHRDEYKSGLCH